MAWSVLAAGIGATATTLGGVGTAMATSNLNKKTREWNEKMMERQNEWSLNQWNRTNEYNDPRQQIARLRAAGLNPLYYGLDGSSANGLESAQPLAWNPSAPDYSFFNDVGASIANIPMMESQLRLQEAQAKDLEASANKKNAETDYQQIINEIADKTKNYKIEGERLSNEIDKKQLAKIDKEMDKIQQDIKESIAREESEWVKQSLMQSEDQLNQVKAYQIVAMLPYEQALAEAKTQHEQAMAGLCWAQAAIQNSLMDEGYAHQVVEELKSRVKLNEAGITGKELDNSAQELENKIKSGEPNELAAWFNEHPWAKACVPAIAFLSGDVFKVANTIQESAGKIVGPVLGVAAGAAAGTAAGKSAGKSTLIVNPVNGKPMVNQYGVPYSSTTQ